MLYAFTHYVNSAFVIIFLIRQLLKTYSFINIVTIAKLRKKQKFSTSGVNITASDELTSQTYPSYQEQALQYMFSLLSFLSVYFLFSVNEV